MSYRIIFKGGVEDMFVSDTRGIALSEAWEQGHLPHVINIDGALLESKTIKAIIPGVKNPDTTKEKDRNMEDLREMEDEYRESKRKKLSLSPQQRAQSTSLASMFFYGVCGRKMTKEERDEVILCQEKFFQEHPNYAEASPICYRHVIDRVPKEPKLGAAKHISDILRGSAIALAQKQVSNGIQK